ncbi:hypothetical protein LKL35_33385 [Streptomyces sp. ET3-23]|uniref:hypothetical protein n=1 Tax=Streptomyces sp. ET3-23 TaxID=2885643 RepID=UPI001D0F62FC|nr:hypothetical protein [Streptomyces sp. ET3-23]MCC2280276.1 hypothetical protein [Streptomyces sp. ET3-23]
MNINFQQDILDHLMRPLPGTVLVPQSADDDARAGGFYVVDHSLCDRLGLDYNRVVVHLTEHGGIALGKTPIPTGGADIEDQRQFSVAASAAALQLLITFAGPLGLKRLGSFPGYQEAKDAVLAELEDSQAEDEGELEK